MKKVFLSLTLLLCITVAYSQTYTFTGNGNWTIAANWSNNTIPPATLPSGSTIYINPSPGDSCVLNTSQTILQGAIFILAPNAHFVIAGNFDVDVTVPLGPVVPSVTTATLSGITASSAISGGTIIANGGSPVTASGLVWNTSAHPTVALSTKTIKPVTSGSFLDTVTGLAPVTTYYVRAYATNAAGTGYGNEFTFTSSANSTPDNVTIGTQIWTTKNLDVTTYRNGDPIPQVSDPSQWENLTTGAWCYFDNNSANGTVYGKLYNFYAVMDPRLAPEGWHVGSSSEWNILTDFLGGTGVAGGKMKAVSSLWIPTNVGATNSSGFTALPGSARDEDGEFSILGYTGSWWTSTEYFGSYGYTRVLGSGTTSCFPDYVGSTAGNSVRLVKNGNEVLPTVTTDNITSLTQRYATVIATITNSGGSEVFTRGFCWSTSPIPTIDDEKSVDGAGTGEFERKMINLSPGTTYYVRAYAVNSVGIKYGNQIEFITLADLVGFFEDSRDHQVYEFKSIGTQVWMTRNLAYNAAGSVCYDSADGNCGLYGRLYNYATALTVAPVGWHLPSAEEWIVLDEFTRTETTEMFTNGELMDLSPLWTYPNVATNSSGFSALPGGYAAYMTTFEYLHDAGFWWTTDGGVHLFNVPTYMSPISNPLYGLSVRCIRD